MSLEPQSGVQQAVQALQDSQGSGGMEAPPLPIDSSIGLPDLPSILERALGEIRGIGEKVKLLEAFAESYRSSELPSLKQGFEELRKGLLALEAELASAKREASITRLIGIVGLWKQPLCANNSEGICTAWRINSDGEIRGLYGDHAVVDMEGVKRVRVSIAYHLCGICPLFRPRST